MGYMALGGFLVLLGVVIGVLLGAAIMERGQEKK